MAITPVGGMIYANQNMQAAATKQTDFQARLDAQNLAATESANAKDKEVREIRPTEETYKIDPEKEHQKEKSDEETGAREEQVFAKKREHQEEEEPSKEKSDPLLGSTLDLKI